MRCLSVVAAATLILASCSPSAEPGPTPSPSVSPTGSPQPGEVAYELERFAVASGSGPHDVAPARDGGVWYTAQRAGALGFLGADGSDEHIPLGRGSAPHGVIAGPDGAAWVTDSGLNAIVRVDASTRALRTFPLPAGRERANLNTATFDGDGMLWFTGQAGVYGRLDPATGDMEIFDAPGGRGPYGIATTPDGDVWYASLAGSHIARIDTSTGAATRVDPPTSGQGARRVWSDSGGRIWVSEWNAGQLAVHEPRSGQWQEWKLPGETPKAYAVFVDDIDHVWVSDFGANALVRFDPEAEEFTSYELPDPGANVRQILGLQGEVWAPASSSDALYVLRRSG